MQMISLGSARASRVDRGALAPVGARHCSLKGGDSTRPMRTARAPSAAREARALPNATETLRLSGQDLFEGAPARPGHEPG